MYIHAGCSHGRWIARCTSDCVLCGGAPWPHHLRLACKGLGCGGPQPLIGIAGALWLDTWHMARGDTWHPPLRCCTGWRVQVYEKRPEPGPTTTSRQRSWVLAMCGSRGCGLGCEQQGLGGRLCWCTWNTAGRWRYAGRGCAGRHVWVKRVGGWATCGAGEGRLLGPRGIWHTGVLPERVRCRRGAGLAACDRAASGKHLLRDVLLGSIRLGSRGPLPHPHSHPHPIYKR